MAAVKPYLVPDVCLIVMAKAPVPGQVKTRLIPTLGQENTAKLYRNMLRETSGKMLRSRICPIQIWCYPNVKHPDFVGLEQQGANLFQQQGNDLGERMHNALAQALQTFKAAVIIGCDCPLMSPVIVQTAFTELSGETFDAVMGPAEDGGYYLLGLKKSPTIVVSECFLGNCTGIRSNAIPSHSVGMAMVRTDHPLGSRPT